MTDEFQTVEGWELPAGIDVPTHRFYEIGSWETKVLDWYGHVEMLHQLDLESIDVDLVDSGFDDSGVQYAAAKATIVVGGNRFSAMGGADTASQQVRDPEHVFSVAETRALKRAIKKALPMRPVKGEPSTPEHRQSGDIPDPELDPDRVVNRDEPETSEPPREKPTAETDEDLDW